VGYVGVGIHRKGEVSLEAILREARKNPRMREAGAIACFIGVVRGLSGDGKAVEGLSYEAYEEEALKALERIRGEMAERDGVVEVAIHHIVDELKVGDDILYVVVAGRSREETFPTLVETIEKVKREAPIFKKETLKEGKSYWVSEAAWRG